MNVAFRLGAGVSRLTRTQRRRHSRTLASLRRAVYLEVVRPLKPLRESAVGEEDSLRDWYALTPAQRFSESQRLWQTFLLLGGSCEPEPDSQSPFYFPASQGESATDGRAGLHPVRRRRVHQRRRLRGGRRPS